MEGRDFWEGKTPCWDVMGCAPILKETCPAYLDRSRPCWDIPNTACDRLLGTESTCDVCTVYALYGPPANHGAALAAS